MKRNIFHSDHGNFVFAVYIIIHICASDYNSAMVCINMPDRFISMHVLAYIRIMSLLVDLSLSLFTPGHMTENS